MRRSSVWIAFALSFPLASTPATPVDSLLPTGVSVADYLALTGRKFQDVAVLIPSAAPGTGDFGFDPCKTRVGAVAIVVAPPTAEEDLAVLIACQQAMFIAYLENPIDFTEIPGEVFLLGSGDFNGDDELDIVAGRRKATNAALLLDIFFSPLDDPTDLRSFPLVPGSGVTLNPALRPAGSMASGRRNADSYDDLVIGLPDATVNGVPRAGAVLQYNGGPNGLGKKPSLIYHRGADRISGLPIANERFGSQVALINFDGVGNDNLIIGSPFSSNGAGVVYFERNDRTFFGQTVSSPGGNLFGWAIAPANLNGDNLTDIVVGAPGVNAGPHRNAGAIYTYLGNPTTPTFFQAAGAPAAALGQTTPLGFGAAFEAFDALGSGTDMIFTGTPCFDLPGKKDAGAVIPVTLPGSLFSPIHLDSPNVPGLARKNEWVNLPNGSTALTTDAAMNALCKGN